jgi:RES domain-containing protein
VTVTVWRIGSDTPTYEAHDLKGKGAELSGGRWNRPGRPVVYAASSIALACLETVVHLNQGGLPLNRYLVRIEIPQEIWAKRRTLRTKDLPVGWNAIPEGKVSLDAGDAWLKEGAEAILLVPSVIVPEESNVLVNALHPDAKQIKATKIRPWLYDNRMRSV